MINFKGVKVGDKLEFVGAPEVLCKAPDGEQVEVTYVGCVPPGWASPRSQVIVSEVREGCVFVKNAAGVAVEFSGDDGAKCLSFPAEAGGSIPHGPAR